MMYGVEGLKLWISIYWVFLGYVICKQCDEVVFCKMSYSGGFVVEKKSEFFNGSGDFIVVGELCQEYV